MVLKLSSSLDWVQGDKYHIKTTDGRFYVSKSFNEGKASYSAWDRKKKKAEYDGHQLTKFDNGFLQIYKTLNSAVKRCEKEARQ